MSSQCLWQPVKSFTKAVNERVPEKSTANFVMLNKRARSTSYRSYQFICPRSTWKVFGDTLRIFFLSTDYNLFRYSTAFAIKMTSLTFFSVSFSQRRCLQIWCDLSLRQGAHSPQLSFFWQPVHSPQRLRFFCFAWWQGNKINDQKFMLIVTLNLSYRFLSGSWCMIAIFHTGMHWWLKVVGTRHGSNLTRISTAVSINIHRTACIRFRVWLQRACSYFSPFFLSRFFRCVWCRRSINAILIAYFWRCYVRWIHKTTAVIHHRRILEWCVMNAIFEIIIDVFVLQHRNNALMGLWRCGVVKRGRRGYWLIKLNMTFINVLLLNWRNVTCLNRCWNQRISPWRLHVDRCKRVKTCWWHSRQCWLHRGHWRWSQLCQLGQRAVARWRTRWRWNWHWNSGHLCWQTWLGNQIVVGKWVKLTLKWRQFGKGFKAALQYLLLLLLLFLRLHLPWTCIASCLSRQIGVMLRHNRTLIVIPTCFKLRSLKRGEMRQTSFRRVIRRGGCRVQWGGCAHHFQWKYFLHHSRIKLHDD